MTNRVGVGVDVHPFENGRELNLAGITWPNETGLAGHSDGDVVAHACADALLSAAGLGDLGSNFGTDKPEWKGASGTKLLNAAAKIIKDAGWKIDNIAVQLIGNKPKIDARREEAEKTLSEAVGSPVSLGATTTDGLGLTGRGEGLAAIAHALINR